MSEPERRRSAKRKQGPVSSIPAERSGKNAQDRENKAGARFALLCLASLGIVFGDIGTSPLHTVRECFQRGSNQHVMPDPVNMLGILSLISWSLIVVISIKYLMYVMAADNKGEGGILALLALVNGSVGERFCLPV
jgi:KUP system potassium uptake protein